MRLLALSVVLAGCTIITSPGDYEGGNADAGAVPCMGDGDCPTGVCDTTRGECVQCLADTDCIDGEECTGGLCGPATCGGVVCPDATPVCLANETEEVCVECVTATDCAPGESCAAGFTCEACMPESPCAADEACVADAAGDFCLDCDVDGDGAIRQDPACAGVAGDPDCDDDDDGFCHATTECLGECDEVARDCDDTDDTVRPTLLACGSSDGTTCGDPGAVLPGDGLGSVSAYRLALLPEPNDTGIRAPSSVVAEDAMALGRFDVVHLADGDGDSYATRSWIGVDADGRAITSGELPRTDLRDFTDLRVKVDPAGTLIAAMGIGTGSGIDSVELTVVDALGGSTVGTPLLLQSENAVPPIDTSVEMLATAVPYMAWCSDNGTSYDLHFGYMGMIFDDMEALSPKDSLLLHTARGLVSAGVRAEADQAFWDPRALLDTTEPRDAGGASALVSTEGTLGFEARFTSEALTVRGVSFTEGGFTSRTPATLGAADLDSRVALGAYNDQGFLAFDGPTTDGDRRIFVARLRPDGPDGTQASEPLELTGGTVPDFDTVYGVEVAPRNGFGAEELAVLVHGTLAGTGDAALYLFVGRRCEP